MIRLYNTLTKTVDNFTPIDKNNIGMYFCGPTVYDRAHIGNLRTSVTGDLLFRVLRTKYGRVTYVRNYTDVDDKILNKSKNTGEPPQTIVARATAAYITDTQWLGNLAPIHSPYATDNIAEMIELITKLVNYNYAYIVDGNVFFEISLFQTHGALSNRQVWDDETESRIGENKLKRNPSDFVLWKPVPSTEMGWHSPWGWGRPGWHIECSAMAKRYLGETFDIHGGGSDLMFPHHDNEISQSCAAHSTERMANYWIHSGILNFNNYKMSKSLGNIVTAETFRNMNISGDALRFVFLSTHYRSLLNFSDENLTAARRILTKFYEKIKDVGFASGIDEQILTNLYNDLNTPAAITRMHELYENGEYSALKSALRLLGFKMQPVEFNDKNIEELLKKRRIAKENKDFETGDLIRSELTSMDLEINDTPAGITWRRKTIF